MSLFGIEAVSTAVLGFVTVGLGNAVQGRGFFARLPRMAAAGALGYGVGYLVSREVRRGVDEREIVLMDYIKNHPDDFPEYRPKKFQEVIEPWFPVR